MFPTERLVTSFGNYHPPCFKCSKCALRKVSKKNLNQFYHQLSVLRPPWTRRALAMENFSASVVTQGVCHAICHSYVAVRCLVLSQSTTSNKHCFPIKSLCHIEREQGTKRISSSWRRGRRQLDVHASAQRHRQHTCSRGGH